MTEPSRVARRERCHSTTPVVPETQHLKLSFDFSEGLTEKMSPLAFCGSVMNGADYGFSTVSPQ